MRFLMMLVACCMVAAPILSHALDLGTSSESKRSDGAESGMSQKKTGEKRRSQSHSDANTRSTGHDTTTSRSSRETSQAGQGGNMEMGISGSMIILKRIATMEQAGMGVFGQCRVISHPQLGIQIIRGEHGISDNDAIQLAGIMSGKTAIGASVPIDVLNNGADERAKHYRDCLMLYGGLVRETSLAVNSSIAELKAVKKQKTGRGKKSISVGESDTNTLELGYEDFRFLVLGVFQQVLKNFPSWSLLQKNEYSVWLTDDVCRFAGSMDKFLCGAAQITFGPQTELIAGGKSYYGQTYGDVSLTYKLTQSWSYSDALEQAKSDSRYSKWAHEVADRAEQLAASGKIAEAVFTKKKAIDRSLSTKAGLSAPNMMQSLH